MKKSNLLISSLTAFAVIGSIGLAVAQTTPTTPADPGAPLQVTPNPGTMPSSPATPSQPTMNNSGSTPTPAETMMTERPVQIDRN